MATVPNDPAIYHITHVDNLASIVNEGGVWCDAECVARGVTSVNVGYLHVKGRRMLRQVDTPWGGTLGQYVPFNFCPRSVMLFVLHCGHDDYDGGQESIVHLVSKVSIASQLGRAWAFTDRHAELGHALHFNDLRYIDQVPWHTMGLTYWSEVKEERQAEFLVREFFPWTAVSAVGAMSADTASRVESALQSAPHRPEVTVAPQWYY